VKKLVLDFDGTLVDASRRDYMLYHDILNVLLRPALTFEEYWPERREARDINELLALSGCSRSDVSDFLEMRRQLSECKRYQRFDVPLPNVKNTLSLLSCEFECCVVTARVNYKNFIDELVNTGLNTYVTRAVHTSGPKLETIRSLSDVVAVVGDTEHDILPAKELGIRSIGLTTGIRSERFLRGLGADVVLNDFADVPHAISSAR